MILLPDRSRCTAHSAPGRAGTPCRGARAVGGVIIKELQRHHFGRRAERPRSRAVGAGAGRCRADARGGERRSGERQHRPEASSCRVGDGSIGAHCRRICRVKRSSSMWPTRSAHAAAASSTGSARTLPERLDIIPAQFKVVVTRRPKYACQGLRRRSGASAGAGAADRERHSHRGIGRACAGRQICRPHATLSPSANLCAPRRHARPFPPWPIGWAVPLSRCARCTRGSWSN